MATDTLTTLDKLVKEQYLPGLQVWLNKRRPFLGRLYQLTKEEWAGGREMVLAVQYSDAQSVGSISEGGTLPDPAGPGIQNMTLAMKYYYATARMSAQAIHSAQTDASGFARSVKTVLDSVKNQLRDSLWVDGTYGDGSGALGQLSNYASTTLTFLDQPTVGMLGTQLLRQNMWVSGYAAKTGGSVTGQYQQLTALTQTTATTAASAGWGNSDYVFRSVGSAAGTQNEDPRNRAIMGMNGHADKALN